MEVVTINIPKQDYNRLNNFYIDNFGYDIHTQLYNYVLSELEKCEEDSSEQPKQFPTSYIRRKRNDYIVCVRYPDNTTSEMMCNTYKECLKYLNEWSKYSFSKDAVDKVFLKLNPNRIKFIQRKGKKFIVMKYIDGMATQFGSYDNFEDAYMVRNFLVKHNWDMKYHSKNLINKYGCNQYTSSNFLLQIVKGEVEI